MKSLGLKIVSILCAISLWFFVVSGKTYTTEIELPLNLIHLSPRLALSTHVPRSVSAIVEGSGLDLIRVKKQENLAWMELDLAKIRLGIKAFNAEELKFRSSIAGVRLVSLTNVNPIEVGIDARIYQQVPVRLHTELKPAKGFVIVGSPVLIPAAIQISGARKVLTRIFEIPTSAIPLNALTSSDTLELALNLEGYSNQVSLKQRTIRVAIEVQKRTTRTFQNLPVQLVGPSQQTHPKISPDHVSLEVTGGEKVLRDLPAQEIRIFLETTRFVVEGSDSLTPTVFIDRPIESWTLTPSTIHLVEKVP